MVGWDGESGDDRVSRHSTPLSKATNTTALCRHYQVDKTLATPLKEILIRFGLGILQDRTAKCTVVENALVRMD